MGRRQHLLPLRERGDPQRPAADPRGGHPARGLGRLARPRAERGPPGRVRPVRGLRPPLDRRDHGRSLGGHGGRDPLRPHPLPLPAPGAPVDRRRLGHPPVLLGLAAAPAAAFVGKGRPRGGLGTGRGSLLALSRRLRGSDHPAGAAVRRTTGAGGTRDLVASLRHRAAGAGPRGGVPRSLRDGARLLWRGGGPE